MLLSLREDYYFREQNLLRQVFVSHSNSILLWEKKGWNWAEL